MLNSQPLTNPMGRSFFSYRHTCRDEADRILASLRDHGIPVWHDDPDLGSNHAEDHISKVLGDPNTGSAVLWLTADVADSDFLRDVEIPLVSGRERAGDGFFMVPILDGVDRSQANALLNPRFSSLDLNQFNLQSAPHGLDKARTVARWILEARLKAIHRHLPPGIPLRLDLSTRQAPPFSPDVALSLDWSRRFQGRTATPEVWKSAWEAVHYVAGAVRRLAPGRRVLASGNLALPAAMMLGGAFLAERGQAISFLQENRQNPGAGVQEWGLDALAEPAPVVCEPPRREQVGAGDVAVLVSVSRNVKSVFDASRAN